MKSIIMLLLLLISSSGFAFSCYEKQTIIQKPIYFDELRIQLTRQYQLEHYGISSDSIDIEPKMIVLHWTSIPTFDATFQLFNSPTLADSTNKRDDLPGNLNVSSHFLVDRDGTIYQLMPETWMARHVIGLNHYAIGIENVGGVDDVQDLTEEQAKSNAFLVCYLQKKYPNITYLIGHKDYLKYKGTSLWLEKDPNYHTSKVDPGPIFMKKVNQLIKDSKP
jgi:hypothetical protein